MEGFSHLPEIRTAKPHLPQVDVEGEPDEPPPPLPFPVQGHWEGENSSECRGSKRSKFKSLMDALLQEHFNEVNVLQKSVDALQKGLREMDGEVVHLRSQNDMIKLQVNVNEAERKPKLSDCSYSEIRREQHKAMKEFHASSILEVIEKEDEATKIENRFQTDIQKFLKAKTQYVTSASGEFENGEMPLGRRQRFSLWLQSSQYEILIAFVLCINVLWMALELQVSGQEVGAEIGVYRNNVQNEMDSWYKAFVAGDMVFTAFFCMDVIVRILVIRWDFFKIWMNYLDVAVSVASLLEIAVFYTLTLPIHPMLFRLLRIGKLIRAVRMVHMTSMLASLQLLVKCISASINMLFWSFCLLAFFQCVAGLIISTLCHDFIRDPDQDPQTKVDVFLYFGTFTRTFLTMFEILFANWGPSCRILVESISEWFSLFFLVYRCILGFAVLNVVNAVFVQQTMKTASSDEELAFKQKEKDIAQYMRKVKRLFQTMDASGDGSINLDEFSKLVKSPKLKFWMSQLELEYHDLLSLFEFLDNGDGEITLMEFVEGAARLRGSAKALDIWRLETKLEVLFEEVFKALLLGTSTPGVVSPMASQSVQDIFDNSPYKHIKAATSPRSNRR